MSESEHGLVLDRRQKLDWLRLIRSEGVGPRTFRGLVNRYGGAGAALSALPRLHRERGQASHVCTIEEAQAEIEAAAELGVSFLASGEAAYPQALAATADAPPLLAVRGDAAKLRRPMVSIVGSRNASALGLRFTERLAGELGEAGFVVVSGLARGIDAKAHHGSLATGTIAVLAGGHERVYPSENEPLLARIVERGVALTEMPLRWEPRGRDFPRRNRIVSGLSLGIVVIEAARGSGSLITARFALDQGREVFAVPGSPLDPRSEGTNDLIRQGATLVTSAQHIIEVLGPLVAESGAQGQMAHGAADSGSQGEPLWDELDLFAEQEPVPSAAIPFEGFEAPDAVSPPGPGLPVAEHVIAVLGASPTAFDDIVRGCGFPAGAVRAALVELELAGRVSRTGGGLVHLL